MAKGLVEYIVKSLVDKPEVVTVQETQQENKRVIQVQVASSDMGKVIGSGGRILRAVRALFYIAPEMACDIVVDAAE